MACVSGQTTGVTYNYVDCCGVNQSGNTVGIFVCLDNTQPYDGINVTPESCSNPCIIYLSGCCSGDLYGMNSTLWTGGLTGTWYFSGVTALPDGCYTMVDTPGPTVIGDISFDGYAEAVLDCSDSLCECDCDCVEITIDSELFLLPPTPYDGIYYVDYKKCGVGDVTVTANSASNIFNICSLSGEPILSYFYTGASPSDIISGYTSDGSPWQPSALEYYVSATTINTCTGEPCDAPPVSPTPTPTPSVTPEPTQTPTPTVTPTITSTNTPTPTVTPSTSGEPVSGDLNASFLLTGECFNGVFTANSGQLEIFPTGGIAPYSVECDSGQSLPVITGIITGGNAIFTGLSADTYTFRLSDSSGGVNDFILINVIVDECFNAGLINAVDTTCGDSNGSLEVSVNTDSYPLSVDLYRDNGGGYILFNTYTLSTIPSYISNLPEGTYYADVTDFGGCTATTSGSTFIISGSTPLEYELVVTNNSNCSIPSGQVEITGLTGSSYTYLWSNGQTTDIITGLTAGTYSVTVTDEFGCELTKTAEVLNSPSLGVVSITTTQPGCLTADGTVTINISGGTGPYYYSGTTGESSTTGSTSFTFTGVTAGSFGIYVQDASLCQLNTSTTLVGGGGLTSVSITQIPTNCGSANNVDIFVNGVPPFTYYYSGASAGPATFVTNSTNYTIPNLPAGTYDIEVSAGSCTYTTGVTVTATPKFVVSATTTGSTCGLSNGSVLIEVGAGYTGVLDYVLSSGQSILDVNLSSYTFNNLVAGTYVITVTDQDGCFISEEFDIETTGDFGYLLNSTNCVLGDDGTASVTVFAGEPPFIYSWSNGESTSSVSGLTGGTYSVTVTDNNGCFETKFFTIICTSQQVSNYNIVPVCDDIFVTTVGNKRSMLQMLNEAFLDSVPSGATNCTLVSAVFACNLGITGYTGTTQWISGDTVNFYTGTSLNDVPSDELWMQTIEDILNSIPEVEDVQIDALNNTVKVFSNCDGDSDPLRNGYIDISLEIDLDISCV